MNSSDADAPPVCTSDTTSDDVGQPTVATSDGIPPGPSEPPAVAIMATTMSAVRPARRARSIDDLPAGVGGTVDGPGYSRRRFTGAYRALIGDYRRARP